MDAQPTIEANEAVEELLALMARGQSLIVTRGGRPIAELRPLPDVERPLQPPSGPADIDWLRRHRVGRVAMGGPDAGELVSRMRDEDWH